MAVSRDAAKRILAKAATNAKLGGTALAWFTGWGEKWLDPWMTEAEYTAKRIAVMADNAAGYARRTYRNF